MTALMLPLQSTWDAAVAWLTQHPAVWPLLLLLWMLGIWAAMHTLKQPRC